MDYLGCHSHSRYRRAAANSTVFHEPNSTFAIKPNMRTNSKLYDVIKFR